MPLLQNEHTVCKRKGFAQIMSDKEHCGLKLLVDAAKKTTQFCTQLWIGIGKRLVQQQYGRILNKRPGDGDSLTLSPGQLARLAGQKPCNIQNLRDVFYPAIYFFLSRMYAAERKSNILIHSQVGVKRCQRSSFFSGLSGFAMQRSLSKNMISYAPASTHFWMI